MELELLPCPFCGSSFIVVDASTSQPARWVLCKSCGASTASRRDNTNIIELWNQRRYPLPISDIATDCECGCGNRLTVDNVEGKCAVTIIDIDGAFETVILPERIQLYERA